MSIFDTLFGGNDLDLANDPGARTGYRPEEDGFDWNGLFSDQNFVRGLGEAGKAVSQGGSAGEVLGDFNTNLIRRRQTQKAAQQTRKEGKTFQDQLLDAIRGGSVLSSKDQNDAFDSFTLDGDGNVSLSMKNTPQKLGFNKNKPLEAMRRSSSGGNDLPDFSEQSSGGEIDFAGLDPEDIAMLLKAEQQFGELNQRDAQLILQEKARREEIVNENKRRQEDLRISATTARQARLDKQAEAEAKILADKTLQDRYDERERLKSNLDNKALTPLEQQEAELNNKKLTAEITKLEKETGNIGKENPTEAKIYADIANKETELGMKLDKLEKDELFSVQPVVTDNKGNEIEVSYEEREVNAQQANNRPNNKVFYLTKPPVADAPGIYKWGTDIPGEVLPVFLPKHPKTGKQITSQDVIDTAKANNISTDEVLKQWRLIK